jgi:hypothetical protein
MLANESRWLLGPGTLAARASLVFLGRSGRGRHRQQRCDLAIAIQFAHSRTPAFISASIRVGVFKDVNVAVMNGDSGWRPGPLCFQDCLNLAVRHNLPDRMTTDRCREDGSVLVHG